MWFMPARLWPNVVAWAVWRCGAVLFACPMHHRNTLGYIPGDSDGNTNGRAFHPLPAQTYHVLSCDGATNNYGAGNSCVSFGSALPTIVCTRTLDLRRHTNSTYTEEEVSSRRWTYIRENGRNIHNGGLPPWQMYGEIGFIWSTHLTPFFTWPHHPWNGATPGNSISFGHGVP